MSEITKTMAQKIVAGEQLKNVIGMTDTQVQAIAVLGYNLLQVGKTDDARKIFRGLVAADETAYYGYAGLGAVELAKESPDLNAAFENLSRAAQLNPKDASVQANLGEVLLRQAKFDESAKVLRQAIELDPQQKDPGANRARALVSGLNTVVGEIQRLNKGAVA